MKRINHTSCGYDSPEFCDIEWITGFDFHDNSTIAEYFEEAGNRLVDSVSKNRKGNADDGLFIPISYLYRHSAELLLKEIITITLSIGFISEEDVGALKLNGEHSLDKLLNAAVKPINKRWPDGDKKALKNMTKVITDLHNMDPRGQGFRYAQNTKQNPTSCRYPKTVSLTEFRHLINEALKMLSGCVSEFKELKNQLEMK